MRRRPLLSAHSFRHVLLVVLVAGTAFLGGSMWRVWSRLDRWILSTVSNLGAPSVLDAVNRQRIERGLVPLTASEPLSIAAGNKAHDMFAKHYWSHVAPDGAEAWDFIRATGYEYELAGENLARDFARADELVEAWLASPSHRENLLNPQFTEAGMAVATGQLDGTPVTIVVALFARSSENR